MMKPYERKNTSEMTNEEKDFLFNELDEYGIIKKDFWQYAEYEWVYKGINLYLITDYGTFCHFYPNYKVIDNNIELMYLIHKGDEKKMARLFN